MYYEVSKGPFFNLRLIILGISSELQCRPSSNIDLVEFVWHNSERVNAIKYAMVLFPKVASCPPKLLCLRYYRAISDGWRDESGCQQCIEDYQMTMRDLTGCQAPGTCQCKFCVRQPPSLRDLASYALFKLKFDISKFELTVHTTFREYVYAVRSGMVDIDRLLPPEYPSIRV